MNDNVVKFPLRGRVLMAAIGKAFKAARRPMTTDEVVEAMGEPVPVVLDALRHLEFHGGLRFRRQDGAA